MATETSLLIFDDEQLPGTERASVVETLGADFLLFDPDVIGGSQEVDAPQTLLLIESPKAPAQVVMPGVEDVLAISSGGPPGPPGPQGLPGEQGPPGLDSPGAYEQSFSFASASLIWTCVHNKNSYAVNVETVDTSGEPVEGNIRYPDANTVEIDWYYPTAGTARIFR